MPTLVKLYEDTPGNLAELDEELSLVHAGLTASGQASPIKHTAKLGDWEVALESSPEGELVGASAVRFRSENYDFERAEDGSWAAYGTYTRFPEAHFYNLVRMATRGGLEWTAEPLSDN